MENQVKGTYYNVILDRIAKRVEILENDIENINSDLKEDFLKNFSWQIKNLYLSVKIKTELLGLSKVIREEEYTSEQTIDYLQCLIDSYKKDLISGSLYRCSTNEISNIQYVYDLETEQKLIKLYDNFIKMLK